MWGTSRLHTSFGQFRKRHLNSNNMMHSQFGRLSICTSGVASNWWTPKGWWHPRIANHAARHICRHSQNKMERLKNPMHLFGLSFTRKNLQEDLHVALKNRNIAILVFVNLYVKHHGSWANHWAWIVVICSPSWKSIAVDRMCACLATSVREKLDTSNLALSLPCSTWVAFVGDQNQRVHNLAIFIQTTINLL